MTSIDITIKDMFVLRHWEQFRESRERKKSKMCSQSLLFPFHSWLPYWERERKKQPEICNGSKAKEVTIQKIMIVKHWKSITDICNLILRMFLLIYLPWLRAGSASSKHGQCFKTARAILICRIHVLVSIYHCKHSPLTTIISTPLLHDDQVRANAKEEQCCNLSCLQQTT